MLITIVTLHKFISIILYPRGAVVVIVLCWLVNNMSTCTLRIIVFVCTHGYNHEIDLHLCLCHCCWMLYVCSDRDYVIYVLCSLLLSITAFPFGLLSLFYTMRWKQALKGHKTGDTIQRKQKHAFDCILAGLVCVSVVFVGFLALLVALGVTTFSTKELKKFPPATFDQQQSHYNTVLFQVLKHL